MAVLWRQIGAVPLAVFKQELARKQSPLLPVAAAVYATIQRRSGLYLAQLMRESEAGTTGYAAAHPECHNALGTKVRGQAPYQCFASWADGAKEWLTRIEDPHYAYAPTQTLAEFIHVYAPASDGNNEAAYVQFIISYLTGLGVAVDSESPYGYYMAPGGHDVTGYVTIGRRPLRIAVGAGHHNTSGGDAFEAALNGHVTNALVNLLKASDGFDVRCYTPQDGLGYYPGPLDAAAGQVNTWLNQGWQADILHEIHHEGVGGNPQPSGCLCIYPDGRGLSSPYANPGDLDLDVQAAAPAMSAAIAHAIGVPVRRFAGNPAGTMSERQTGVGEQGYRLGIFGRWAVDAFINSSCRFISEAAVYTNIGERAKMSAPDFPAKEARGIADAYVALATGRMGWTSPYWIGRAPANPPPAPPPPPDPTYPPHADRALAESRFGQIVNELGDFHFDPHGPVSTTWLKHWQQTGLAPQLTAVVKRGDGKLFTFDGGLLIYADSRQAVVMTGQAA